MCESGGKIIILSVFNANNKNEVIFHPPVHCALVHCNSPIDSLEPHFCNGIDSKCQQYNTGICSPKTLNCICEFGSYDNGTYCEPIYCSSDYEKRCILFPNTYCESPLPYSRCKCKPQFHMNPDTQQCEAKIALNYECTDNGQCGQNALCSKELGRCTCESNEFTPLKVNCLLNHCKTHENCTETLGDHSECPQNGNCACKGDYIQDGHNDQCVLKYKLIGENCTQQADCSPNAFCRKLDNGLKVGFCSCKLAYQPLNSYQCQEFSCYDDMQCNSTWNFYDTYCNTSTNMCTCKEGLAVGVSGRCERSAGFVVKSAEMFSFVSLLIAIVLILL